MFRLTYFLLIGLFFKKKAKYLICLGADVNYSMNGKSELSWANDNKDTNLTKYLVDFVVKHGSIMRKS